MDLRCFWVIRTQTSVPVQLHQHSDMQGIYFLALRHKLVNKWRVSHAPSVPGQTRTQEAAVMSAALTPPGQGDLTRRVYWCSRWKWHNSRLLLLVACSQSVQMSWRRWGSAGFKFQLKFTFAKPVPTVNLLMSLRFLCIRTTMHHQGKSIVEDLNAFTVLCHTLWFRHVGK